MMCSKCSPEPKIHGGQQDSALGRVGVEGKSTRSSKNDAVVGCSPEEAFCINLELLFWSFGQELEQGIAK